MNRTRAAVPVTLLVILFLSASPALGDTIHVPLDQPTIQEAIMAAFDGDLVLVASMVYVENIDFLGKAITVQSEEGAQFTIIDGTEAASVVTFDNGETEASILDGFSLINGNGTYFEYLPGLWYSGGGGILCYESSPTITNCTIWNNYGGSNGGGVSFLSYSDATITNCMIIDNRAVKGGGIDCYDHSDPTITNCMIIDNYASCGCSGGGGMHLYNSAPTITHCTFSLNRATGNGGAIYCRGSDPVITNCIFWGDTAGDEDQEIHLISGIPVVTYSDVAGGYEGEGNIDLDPLFVGGGNFHLTGESPCVDAGTDAGIYEDMDGDERPMGSGFDMGADEYFICWDRDHDGYQDEACGGDDCDDSTSDTYPGAEELCDGMDNDCDEQIDERDMDGDGYIDEACGGDDCDDDDPLVYPGYPESYKMDNCADGKDNDCDGMTDTDPKCTPPCSARIVPIGHGPIALCLIPVLALLFLGRRVFG